MQQRLLLLFFGLIITLSISAQQRLKRQYHFVELKPHFGHPIIYSDSLSSTLNKYFLAGDIRWGTQTNGERKQDQNLAFPSYGLGIYHAYLNSPDTLGRPWAVYAFYNGPIIRLSRFTLGYDIALGIAWHFSKFDPISNSKNDLIGSDVNAYFNGGIYLKYRLSKRLDISAAVDFTHFSNGSMQTPNKGMNLRGGNLSLSYNFNTGQKTFKNYERPKLEKKNQDKIAKYNELNITATIGGKATPAEYGTGPKYFTSSSMIDFNRRYNWIGKFGLGVDWFVDNSISEDYINTPNTPITKYMFLGIHLSHELILSKISAVTQAGTYLWKGSEAKGWFFFRLQLRYYISSNWYAVFGLKTANGFKADYLEFGFGHRIKFR